MNFDSLIILLVIPGATYRETSESLEWVLFNYDPFVQAALFGDPCYAYQGKPMSTWF